jgi:hypothetical protein
MFKKVLVVLLLIIAGTAVAVALQPDEFKVTRWTKVNAPPAAAFDQVNDFHKWTAWSPWAKLDPAMKQTFSGPESGVGAKQAWVGNSDVGEGSATITESKPNETIHIKLEFVKPFAGTNDVEFTFVPEGNLTVVTWSMWGKSNFMCKAMNLVGFMDSMVGGQFEEGLAGIKKQAEAQK